MVTLEWNGVAMILESLAVDADDFASGTGWTVEPEGACRGEVCIPLDGPGAFDLGSAADRLGMALVHDADAGLWALGPATVSGRALTSTTAPELALPTVDGSEFDLSSLIGEKVVIVAWAPY